MHLTPDEATVDRHHPNFHIGDQCPRAIKDQLGAGLKDDGATRPLDANVGGGECVPP